MRFIKKALRDLALTLYDDPEEFKCMSMPRVWCAISGIVVVVAWFTEQFFGKPFASWSQLIAWATACLGAYGVKKYTERGRQ